MTYQEEVLFQAKAYAAKGWHVIPLYSVNEDGTCTCGDSKCTDIGKHPTTRRGLKDGSRDLAQIDRWFGGPTLLNVGIVTGEISGITVSNILKGIHQSMAGRYMRLLTSARTEGVVLVTGGLAADVGLLAAMREAAAEQNAEVDVRSHTSSILAGALGAAIWGAFRARKLAGKGVPLPA